MGLTYDEDGNVVNPFAKPAGAANATDEGIKCDDGSTPDSNGCCPGENYEDTGDGTFACCLPNGGECIEPFVME